MPTVNALSGVNSAKIQSKTTENSDIVTYSDGEVRYDLGRGTTGPHDDTWGQAGAGYSTTETDVYVSGGFNEATDSTFGAAEVTHSVSDDTTVYGVFRGAGSGESGGEVGVASVLEDGGVVTGALGYDPERGKYAEGQWTEISKAAMNSVSISASENGGVQGKYSGSRSGEDWRVDGELTVDSKGSVVGKAAAERVDAVGKATALTTGVLATTEGDVQGKARLEHAVDAATLVAGEVTVRSDGTWSAGVDGARRINNEVGINGVATVNSDGLIGIGAGVAVETKESRLVGDAVYMTDRGESHRVTVVGGYTDVKGSGGGGRVSWDSEAGLSTGAMAKVQINKTGHVYGEVNTDLKNNKRIVLGGNQTVLGGKGSVGGGVSFTESPVHVSRGVRGQGTVSDLLGHGENVKAGVGFSEDVLKRSVVDPGRDSVGQLRMAVLEDSPSGTAFVEYGAMTVSNGSLGAGLPTGPGLGVYVNGELEAGMHKQVHLVKLTSDLRLGETPTEEELKVPANAAELLKLKPGESFTVAGDQTHGVSGGAGVSFGYGAVGARAGVNAGVSFSGNTETEVVRGGGESARLILRKGESTGNSRGFEVKVGLDHTTLLGAGVAKGSRWEAFLAFLTRIIEGIIKAFLSVGGKVGKRKEEGDTRLMDVGLDLSREDVRCAYDKAMAGDWSDLERMGRDGDPGVALDRSIFTEINQRAIPLALHGFGMTLDQEGSETLKESDVVTAFGVYDVDSDEDRNHRKTGGLFKNTSYSVSDYSRTVKAREDAELGGLKAEENWMTWSHQQKDVFTSDAEVVGASTLASYLLEGEEWAMLQYYCDAVSALPERRKLWMGPRNELRNTQISTTVVFSDGGLEALKGIESESIWSAYAFSFRALNPGVAEPSWLEPGNWARFARGDVTLDEAYAHAEFLEAEVMVNDLKAAAGIESEEVRNDAVREVLFKYRDNPGLVAACVDLVGREHVYISFEVDSTAGETQFEYDCSLQQVGALFDVQMSVFGEVL